MKIIAAAFLIAICNIGFSQPFILGQGNNDVIYLVDISTNEFVRLDEYVAGELCGYEIENNKIVCYYSLHGKVSTKTYEHNLKSIPRYKRSFTPDYETERVDVRYFNYKDYKLKFTQSDACMFKNDTVLWGNCYSYDSTPETAHWLTGYLHPQISDNRDFILIEQKSTPMWRKGKSVIIEVDMKTGKRTVVGKGDHASYAPGGKYVLFKAAGQDYYNLYGVDDKKLIDYHSYWTSAYWLVLQ